MFEIDLVKYYPQLKVDKTALCNIRKRLISCTPEETIRQAFITFLIKEKGYPIDKISIEVPMSRFDSNSSGRADILIYGNDQNVLCLIECKEPNEFLSENIYSQVSKYDEIVKPETCCILIGGQCYFMFYEENNDKPLLATEFPSYQQLVEKHSLEYFDNEEVVYKRMPFKRPDREDIDWLYENGIFGNNTDKKYLPFLINLYNFYFDDRDKVNLLCVEDVGLKAIKYGNAGSGVFAGHYRSFLVNDQQLVSFSISSMTRGQGFPINTSLMFGVDTFGKFHLSLELRVDKHVTINDELALITHDGSITVGKLGAAKKIDLINFIKLHKPDLIIEGRIFLGKFDISKDIRFDQENTILFIKNCIDYALIRDEFRKVKKASANSR